MRHPPYILLLVSFLLLVFTSTSCRAAAPENISESISLDFNLVLPPGVQNSQVDLKVFIVSGSQLDVTEKLLLEAVKAQVKTLNAQVVVKTPGDYNVSLREIRVSELDDSPQTFALLNDSLGVIILVGGPSHNNISREYYRLGYIKNESRVLSDQFTVGLGETGSKSSVVVYSHRRVEGNLEREAVKYSPLRDYVPQEYIPVAATVISISLLSLISLLINLLKTVFEFKALEVGRKTKKHHLKLELFGVDLKEILAVFGASFVLGLSVTWTFLGPGKGFLWMLVLNMAVSLFAALSHELVHRVVGRIFGIRMKYHFWWTGSFVTLVSGYFGNAFGIQGFLTEHVEGEVSKWKYGLTKLAAPVFSTIIAVFAVFMNMASGIQVFQTVYIISSMWAMAEILPLWGLDGYDIKKWNWLVWLFFFVVISAVFGLVNFII